MKKGVSTSELWVTVGAGLTTVIASLVALFVGLSFFDEQTGNLIIGVTTSLVSLAVVVAPAYLAVRYTQARTEQKRDYTQARAEVKKAQLNNGG